MNSKLLPVLPGLLHKWHPGDIDDRLSDVELDQGVYLVILGANQVVLVFDSKGPDIAQPGFE